MHTPALPLVCFVNPVPACVCSAALRALLATNDKEMADDKETIEELTKQLRAAKLNSKHECVGLYTTKKKDDVRKVYLGPMGGIYTETKGGSKPKPDDADWERMPEAEVDRRIAAHEEWKASSPTK